MADAFLRLEFRNQQPVELLDLTTSFMALGEAFEDYVVSHGFDPLEKNVRLYIRELRTGSIIADLHSLLDQASFVLDHGELFVSFLTNLNDVIQFFLALTPKSEATQPTPPRVIAERAAQVLEPVAKDGGSQLFMNVAGDLHVHTHFHYNSEQANVYQNRVRKHFGPRVPTSQTFQREPLTLVQVRDDPRGRTGDRGVIERFSSKPIRLLFMNEEAKRRVLEQPDNPFRLVFLVDGEMSTAGGREARRL